MARNTEIDLAKLDHPVQRGFWALENLSMPLDGSADMNFDLPVSTENLFSQASFRQLSRSLNLNFVEQCNPAKVLLY